MLIGITGGIGSGKTTIVKALAARGYFIYDSDKEAKRLMAESIELRNQILKEFKTLDKKELSAIVFTDENQLQKLNAIVHPAIFEDVNTWGIKNEKYSPLFVESAILFECHMDKLCDATIAIIAPQEIRIERTINRDNVTREEVLARIDKQMNDEEKAARATFVINNDGTKPIEQIAGSILLWSQELMSQAHH